MLAPNVIQLWFASTFSCGDSALSDLAWLSSEERRRAYGFRSDKDRRVSSSASGLCARSWGGLLDARRRLWVLPPSPRESQSSHQELGPQAWHSTSPTQVDLPRKVWEVPVTKKARGSAEGTGKPSSFRCRRRRTAS